MQTLLNATSELIKVLEAETSEERFDQIELSLLVHQVSLLLSRIEWIEVHRKSGEGTESLRGQRIRLAHLRHFEHRKE